MSASGQTGGMMYREPFMQPKRVCPHQRDFDNVTKQEEKDRKFVDQEFKKFLVKYGEEIAPDEYEEEEEEQQQEGEDGEGQAEKKAVPQDTKRLPLDNVRDLMLSLTSNPDVSEYGIGLVMDATHKNEQDMFRRRKSSNPSFSVAREPFVKAFMKFRYYLDKQKEVEEIYKRLDPMDIGAVEKKQIKLVVDNVKVRSEDEQKVFGRIYDLQQSIYNDECFYEDLNFALKDSYLEEDGSVRKSEMLPAIATWARVGQAHYKAQHSGDAAGRLFVMATFVVVPAAIIMGAVSKFGLLK